MSRSTDEFGGSGCKKPQLQTGGISKSSVVSINDLPENVLAHILTLLPMKDAVRTSVLSKEWEYRWALVYDIQIVEDDLIVEPTQSINLSFINFVDRILLHSLHIETFYLSCHHMSDPCRLKIWIASLSTRNVQSIRIVSSHCGGFTLPPCLLDMTSLDCLELDLPCIIKVPPRDYLLNLTILSLDSIQFQNECLSDTVTGLLHLTLPVLEVLYLNSCTWGDVKLVELNSPALTTFHCISQAKDVADDFLIKICGARLEVFHIGGVLLNNFDLSASSVSSVVDAAIINEGQSLHPFIGASGLRSRGSITKFLTLRFLRLSGQIGMPYAQLMPGVPLPKFIRLKRLQLTLSGTIKAFLELLQMAPNLEQLIMTVVLLKKHKSEDLSFDEVESVPSCMLSRLAEIKFCRFHGTTHEFDLVKFLLKNSLKLQKAAFYVSDEPRIPKADIKKMLSTYPKGSPCISVVFT